MNPVLETVAWVAFGAWGMWLVQRPHIQWLKDELVTAQERLYMAWRDDKAIIPSRGAVEAPEAPEVVPLPAWAFPLILDFDSPQGKQQAEAFIRQGIAQGKGQSQIAKELAVS